MWNFWFWWDWWEALGPGRASASIWNQTSEVPHSESTRLGLFLFFVYTLPRVSSLNPLPLNTLAALRNSISLLETYACTIESLFAIFIWIANKNFYFNEMKTGFYSPESLQSSSAYKASPHTWLITQDKNGGVFFGSYFLYVPQSSQRQI